MELKIAENIRIHRQRLNLTQSELADRLFSTKSLISNYENHVSTPDILTLWLLADIFEISIDELIGRDLIK